MLILSRQNHYDVIGIVVWIEECMSLGATLKFIWKGSWTDEDYDKWDCTSNWTVWVLYFLTPSGMYPN